jgi:hypothetical protein
MPFGEVLEIVDQMSLEEQEAIIEILRQRLAEEGRKRIAADIEESRAEFAAGNCRLTTTDELLGELLS